MTGWEIKFINAIIGIIGMFFVMALLMLLFNGCEDDAVLPAPQNETKADSLNANDWRLF